MTPLFPVVSGPVPGCDLFSLCVCCSSSPRRGQTPGGRGGTRARTRVFPVPGVRGHKQASGLDSERGDPSARTLGAPRKPRHDPQTHPERHQHGHERLGEVRHGQSQEQRRAHSDVMNSKGLWETEVNLKMTCFFFFYRIPSYFIKLFFFTV